jgi:hypothetical protein
MLIYRKQTYCAARIDYSKHLRNLNLTILSSDPAATVDII